MIKFKLILFVFYFAIVGFALNPKNADTSRNSDILLSKQFDDLNAYLQDKSPDEKIYIYVGSAQNSQSTAFMNDVLLVNQKLLQINPNFKSIILSNEINFRSLRYPFATLENLNKTFNVLSEISKKYQLTLVTLISTHGNIDLLSVNINNSYYQPVKSDNILNWLNSLSKNSLKTVLISACYSGSFIEPLRQSNTIVLTASAKDRISFGCHPRDKNTYFIQELFSPDFDMRVDWLGNFVTTEKRIVLLEKKERQSPNSNPQILVPDEFKNIPIFNLLN
jgi:hypothetical protein